MLNNYYIRSGFFIEGKYAESISIYTKLNRYYECPAHYTDLKSNLFGHQHDLTTASCGSLYCKDITVLEAR